MKIINIKLVFTASLLVLFMLFFSFNISANETLEEIHIQLKAKTIVFQINEYLNNNPEKTIDDLKKDIDFRELAIQKVGDRGYTILLNADTGEFYFHPREEFIGKNIDYFKEDFFDLWAIFDEVIGKDCDESSGFYEWIEQDEVHTNKYMHLMCINNNLSGANLALATTAYLDEFVGIKYAEQYHLDDFSNMLKIIVKQKVKDTTKQIDLYLDANPNKSVKELQNDSLFQSIAVQNVFDSGYTTVMDSEYFINYFHKNSEFIGVDYNTYKNSRYSWFKIIEKTRTCFDSYGFYNWLEPNGDERKKFAYYTCTENVVEGRRFLVGATVYLDELSMNYTIEELTSNLNKVNSASEYDYPPFSIILENGSITGFSVELLKKTLNAVDFDVDFYSGEWSNIKKDLIDEKIHVLPLVGRTPEREQYFDFTVPYITLYGAAFTRINGPRITSLDDLKNKEILVMKGDNSEEFVKRNNISSKIISVDKFSDAFELLSAGKYDVVIIQEMVGHQLLDELNISNVKSAFTIREFKQDFTFAVSKGNRNLLFLLNEGLSRIISDGTYNKLYEEWIENSQEISSEQDLKQESLAYSEILFVLIFSTIFFSYFIFLSSSFPEKYSYIKKYYYAFFIFCIFLFFLLAIEIFLTNNMPINHLYLLRLMHILGITTLLSLTLLFLKLSGTTLNKYFLLSLYLIHIIVSFIMAFSNKYLAGYELQPNNISQIMGSFGKILILITIIYISLIIYSSFNQNFFTKQEKRKYLLILIVMIVIITFNSVIYSLTFSEFPYFLLTLLILNYCVWFLLILLKRITFKQKMMILVSILFFVLISGLLIYNSWYSSDRIKEITLNNELNKNDLIINENILLLNRELNNFISHLDVIAERVSLMEQNSKEENNILYYSYKKVDDKVYAIYRINSSNHITNMYPLNNDVLNSYIGDQEHMVYVQNELKPVISDVFDAVEGFKGITIHYPLIIDGNYEGTVAYLIDIVSSSTTLFEVTSDIFDELYLVDSNDLIIYSNKENTLSENINEFLINDSDSLINIKDFKIYNIDWKFINIEKEKTILSGINSLVNYQKVFTVTILLFILVLGIVINRLFNSNLHKEIKKNTKELALKVAKEEKNKKAIIHILSDFKKLNIDLKEANKNLKELDKAKSEFLNIISHELKTPLTALNAHIDVIEDSDVKFTEQNIKSLSAIRRNSNQLKILINNLLEISRMESGKFELTPIQTNLKDLVIETTKELDILIKQKDIKIKLDLEEIKSLMIDDTRIKQVLNNLLTNAVKFTDKGSIKISLKKKNNFVELSVKDTGIGIPKDKINNLFTKFYQVDASVSRRYGGTGLGLFITKKIIEAHGGKITVESKYKKGSTFKVTLPYKSNIKSHINKKENIPDPFGQFESRIKSMIDKKENKNGGK